MRIHLLIILLTLLFIRATTAADYPGLEPHSTIPSPESYESAAEELLDVPYLDDGRDTLTYGNNHKRELTLAYRSRLNVYVPKGKGPFPCLLYVHGGSYTTGHATGFNIWSTAIKNGVQIDPAVEGLKRGYVLVCFNYILGAGSIHPQVQRDFKEAIRFLRANRGQYKIDPNRMGAIGASAGGWLVTSSGFTTADDFGSASQSSRSIATLITDPKAWAHKFHYGSIRKGYQSIIFSSFDETTPRHEEISSRLNVLVFDYFHQMQAVTPDDPDLITIYNGSVDAWWAQRAKEGRLQNLDLVQQKTTLIDFGKFNPKEFDPRKATRLMHIPSHNLPVPAADGNGSVPAVIRIFDLLDEKLKKSARTPAAEARPNARFFKDAVDVTFATAGPDTTVHVTLDGSEPTVESPVATQPIRVDATTTVKYIAVAPGLPPSGVATATFIKDQPLPRTNKPAAVTLPVATVGKPYEVQFEAEGATRWHFQIGNPGIDRKKVEETIIEAEGRAALKDLKDRSFNLFHLGLDADPKTGRMFGTPQRPGTYMLQVVTARDEFAPGGCRTYTLVVLPKNTQP